MKKRFLCLLLATVMLLSLVAAAPLPVRAQSNLKTSDALVELLTKFEGFTGVCVLDGSQRSVGYGTRCDKCDDSAPGYPNNPCTAYTSATPITEAHARQLMKNFLTYFEGKLNAFADKHNITFTQNEFDALISFTYNCGEGWMLESYDPEGNFRNAIISRATGDQLVYAFGLWSKSGNTVSLGHVRRRMIEADVYLNGRYASSNAVWPENLRYVYLDGNGGTTRYYYQAFHAAEVCPIRAEFTSVPKDGQGNALIFDGWYTKPEGGVKVESLTNVLQNGHVLYAHWKNSAGQTVTVDTDNSHTVDLNVIMPNWWPNTLYEGPGTYYSEVRKTTYTEQLHLTKIVTGKDGAQWGYCGDGWVPLSSTNYSSVVAPTGTWYEILTSDLSIRTGPSAGEQFVGFKQTGDQILVVATQEEAATNRTWAKMSDGNWVCIRNGETIWGKKMDPQPPTQPVEVPGITITGISLVSAPTRKDYLLNGLDVLPDLTGGRILIQYSDKYKNTEVPITRHMVSGFDNTREGQNTITVSVGGKTVSFKVNIVNKILDRISISSNPTKTTYLVGESLNRTGLQVMAHYQDGTSEAITAYTLSSFNPNQLGEQTITVAYSGKTASFKVNVIRRDLVSLTIASKPTKLTYFVGEEFNKAGLKVKANYSDNTSEEVTAYTVSGFNKNTAGTQTITVTYSGKTATFTVEVKNKTVSGIAIKSHPTKLEYIQGNGDLNVTGGVIRVTYAEGGTEDINMTNAMVTGFDNLTLGTQTLTVTYKGFSVTYSVTVIKPTITFLNYDGSLLAKVQFALGEQITAPMMPTRPDDAQGSYEFDGWDRELLPCTGNATYTATFKLRFEIGDLDRNKSINEDDVIYLLRHLVYPERYPIYATADFDKDGDTDEDDVIYLLRHLVYPDKYPL